MDDQSENHRVGESFGEGKLWIKLKFPKTEETELTEAKSDDQVRICDICNREFSNGKALGGHMRVHVQEKNKRDLSPKIMSKNPVKSVRNSVEKSQHLVSLSEKPNCPLCGKGFPSIKSLFGHMRCHPEREYRGICPPQTGLNHLSSSSSFSDEREEIIPSLPKWSAKAKRGRCSLVASATSSSSEDECFLSEEDKEAAYDLMSLAQGEPFIPSLSLGSKHKVEVTNSNSLVFGGEIGSKDRVFESKKRRFRDLGYGSTKVKQLRFNEAVSFEGKGKGEALFASSENSLSDDEFEGKDSDGSVSSDELITNMRSKRKKLKFRDLKSVENDRGDEENDKDFVEKEPLVKYKCSTCNKCFPSHQALGGHRSSHTKPKYAKQAFDSEPALVTKFDTSPNISDEKKDSNTVESVVDPLHCVPTHQCTICPKSFATGQALGGHMRCHWTGPGPTEGPSSSHAMSSPGQMGLQSSNVMSSSPGEEASRTRGLELDLNELPLIEDEDEDGGVESQNANGMLLYGGDFSSHNSAV